MHSQIRCSNWWSKALFLRNFEEQFYIPKPPRKSDRLFLQFLERMLFSDKYKDLKIEKPIFIVGLPRSGTTLLYNLFCAHPQAAYITTSINSFIEAPRAIEWLRKRFHLNIKGERFLADSIDVDFGSPSEPIMYWGKWFKRAVDDLHWKKQSLNDFSSQEIESIYDDIKKIISCFPGQQQRFVLKYPLMQTELPLVHALFPDAKFIHIVRDGRMVANSMVKLYNISNDQIKKIKHPLIDHILPYPRVEKLGEYLKSWGPTSLETTSRVWRDSLIEVEEASRHIPIFTLRYEDLLLSPETELREVFEFAHLPWPSNEARSFFEVYDSIGKIRHTNNYSGYELVENRVGPWLKKLNYIS